MSNQIIDKEVLVNASLNEVWNRWTTEDGIRTFFAEDCNVELRVGGAYEMYFITDGTKGERGSEGCKVLSFLPYEMFSFTWNAPPSYPTVRNSGEYTYVVINFEEIKKNKIKVRLRHLGWQDGEEWDKVFTYFDRAWDKVLGWLTDSFEK